MKVLNLACAQQHRFEGWFASDEEQAAQLERGLLACPLCGDKAITRLPSAPRVQASKTREVALVPDAASQRQSQWLRAVRQLIANTEDVGERFPEEARRIHYGEVPHRGIRGRASSEESEALRDEGIEVVAVALPEALKGPVQ